MGHIAEVQDWESLVSRVGSSIILPQICAHPDDEDLPPHI